jgi:hypothetical protein
MDKVVGPTGWLGPNYDFANELPMPSEIGVKRGGGFNDIMKAVGGVNYYADAIGFGQSTGLAKAQGMQQTPLGVRFFMKTGAVCSNGEDLYEYVDTTPQAPKGRINEEVQKTLGVQFRGLAPGIVQDGVGALNPIPLFNAFRGSGYARCKRVTLPVGDLRGRLAATRRGGEPVNQWVDPRNVQPGNQETRWVFDKWISQEEYDKSLPANKKQAATSIADMVKNTAGFANPPPDSSNLLAGVLFAALVLGTAAYMTKK